MVLLNRCFPLLFHLQQPTFPVKSASIASKVSIGSNDTMAGYDERDGVVCDGSSHSDCRAFSQSFGNLAVGGCLAEGNVEQLLPHLFPEIRGAHQ